MMYCQKAGWLILSAYHCTQLSYSQRGAVPIILPLITSMQTIDIALLRSCYRRGGGQLVSQIDFDVQVTHKMHIWPKYLTVTTGRKYTFISKIKLVTVR